MLFNLILLPVTFWEITCFAVILSTPIHRFHILILSPRVWPECWCRCHLPPIYSFLNVLFAFSLAYEVDFLSALVVSSLSPAL